MKCFLFSLSLLLVLPMLISAQAQKKRQPITRTVGMIGLASHTAVHKDLKLNEEQSAALKQASQEARKESKAAQKLTGDARRKSSRELTSKLRATIAKTLNEEQKKRFLQIELQWSSGAWIFNRAAVSKSLELTKDQKKELRELAKKSQKTSQDLRATLNDDNRQEVQRKIAATLYYDRQSAIKLLTDDQKENWKKATGKPLDLPRGNKKKRKKKQQ